MPAPKSTTKNLQSKFIIGLIIIIGLILGGIIILKQLRNRNTYNYDIQTSNQGSHVYTNTNSGLSVSFLDRTDPHLLYQLLDEQLNASLTFYLDSQQYPDLKNTHQKSQLDDNKLTVKDIAPHTDLIYQITENGVKEDIRLNTSEATASASFYSFIVKASNLRPVQSPDGSLLPAFINQSGQPTDFQLIPPFMVDAKGIRSDNVSLTIEPYDNPTIPVETHHDASLQPHTYRIIVTPDPQWLNSPDRAFPISIDPTVVKGNAPVADWSMDEATGTTIGDTTSSNNDLTLSGATWQKTSTSPQPHSTFVQLDGSNDYLTRATDTDFDFGTGSFSISGWFKHTSEVSGTDTILARYSTAGFKIYMDSSGYMCFAIDDDATWAVKDSACSSSTQGSYADSKWHHIEVVKSSTSSITLYIDGTQISQDASLSATGSLSNSTALYLGIDSDGSSNPWTGSLDQFTIYNYARTALQVKADAIGTPQTAAFFGSTKDTLTDGLIGHWKLDETTANTCTGGSNDNCDSSGNATDGAWNGNSANTPGKFGNGVSFDGTGDYIQMSSSSDEEFDFDATESFTISMWAKLTDDNTIDSLINKSNGSLGSTDNAGFDILYRGDTTNVTQCRINDGSGTSIVGASTNSNVGDSSWHHVLCTVDRASNTMRLYLDGVLGDEDSISSETGSMSVAQPLRIGTHHNASDWYATGTIDDVRIYNRAFSPDQVKALHNWASGPVANWDFNDNTGTTVNDRSGNGHSITFPSPESGGFVVSVEYVEVALSTASSQTSNSTNLSLSQDTSNSVPFVTSIVNLSGNAGDSDDFSQILADVYFESGPDRVTVQRANGDSGTGTITFGIYVVEFDPTKVSVQQGVVTFTGTTDTDTITAVDQTKTAMTFYYRLASAADNDGIDGAMVAGWFSADTTLSWERNLADGTITGHYYVFEALNDEFSVQASTFSIGAAASSNTATISSIDTAKTFVIGSHRTSETGDNSLDGFVSIYLNSATQVGAARSGTTNAISDIRTFAITFNGDESVQRGTFSYASDDAQETATITAVDTDLAMAWNPNTRQGNMLNSAADSSDVSESFQKVKLANTTTVQGDRTGVDQSTASGRWEVVQFVEGVETAPEPTWASGKFGSALNFDGTDDYISLADNANFDFAAADGFTVGAWIKHDGTISATDYILTKADTTTGGYKLYMDDSGDLCFAIDDDATWTPDDSACTSGIDYDDSAWHYVTGIKTGTSKIELYVDGILVASDSSIAATSTLANGNALYIGVDRDGTSNGWDGLIDDVRIYNYVRSSSQIIEDFNGGHPVGGSPIGSQVGYWKFDEGYSTTAYDFTPNANNLTLSTASWTNSGKFNKAWDGTGALWLSRADDADFDFTASEDFSISGWFKHNTASAAEVILQKFESTGADGGYRIQMESDGDISFGIDDDNTSFPEDSVTSTLATYDDDAWHHFVAIKTGTSSIRLYIDANEVGTADTSISSTNTLANDDTLYVGDSNGSNGSDEFNGDLDELKIYRTALTLAQIRTEYLGGVSTKLGSLSTTSAGIADNSAARSYCVPGDSTSCSIPALHLPLNENAGTSNVYDISGNAHTATLNSITASSWVPGKLGSGLQLDGSADYINVTDASDLRPGTGSFSAFVWAKLPNTTAYYRILSKNLTSDPWTEWAIIQSGGPLSNGKQILVSYWENASNYHQPITTNDIADDQWHHVGFVANSTNSTVTIYVDGMAVPQSDSTAGSWPNINNTNDLSVGRENSGAEYFPGIVDDIRVYNYARTPAQVAWDYNRGAPVAWYKMDECTGTTINDWGPKASGGFNGGTGILTIGASGTNDTAGSCSGDSSEAWENGETGKLGYSISLDGTDDYITVTDNDRYTFATSAANIPFSITAWVNMVDATQSKIVSKYDDTTASKKREFEFYFSSSDLLKMLVWDETNDGYIGRQWSTAFTQGQWIHVAGTYDGGTTAASIKLYANGVQVDDANDNSGTFTLIRNTTANLMIGHHLDTSGSPAYHFEGKLDDVRIYNYTLTSTQIKEIMNSGAVNFQ